MPENKIAVDPDRLRSLAKVLERIADECVKKAPVTKNLVIKAGSFPHADDIKQTIIDRGNSLADNLGKLNTVLNTMKTDLVEVAKKYKDAEDLNNATAEDLKKSIGSVNILPETPPPTPPPPDDD